MTSPKVWEAAELIHARLCCQTLESCFEGQGGCVGAAYKLYRDGLLDLEKPVSTEKEIGPEDGWRPVRERTLDAAARLISGDRAKDYGDAGEVRTTSSTGAQKGVKPERYDLIPVEALAEVARHYGRGAEKYAAHNWRKGYEWSKSFAALMRHAQQFWAGENIDEETGSHHMAGVVFHALSLITFTGEHPEMDDRWKVDADG